METEKICCPECKKLRVNCTCNEAQTPYELGRDDERKAIIKWLREGDLSCDCCGMTREVNHIEGSPIDFDQLCPECHFTKHHIAKNIEAGEHIK